MEHMETKKLQGMGQQIRDNDQQVTSRARCTWEEWKLAATATASHSRLQNQIMHPSLGLYMHALEVKVVNFLKPILL